MTTNTRMSLKVISINIKVSRNLTMGYCTVGCHCVITTTRHYSFSLLLEKAGNKSGEESGVKQAPGQQAMAMSELWCAKSGQGDQQILEQAANTRHHEKISPALKCKVTEWT